MPEEPSPEEPSPEEPGPDVTIYGFVTGAHGAEQAFDSLVKSKPGTAVTGLGDEAETISELTGTLKFRIFEVGGSVPRLPCPAVCGGRSDDAPAFAGLGA